MNDFLLSQVIAAVAFACGAISFQYRSRRAMLFWFTASALGNAGHFLILHVWTAVILYLILGARSFVSAFTTNRMWMYLFMGLALMAFVYTYENHLSWLALLATLLATYGSFQAVIQRARVLFMLAALTWLAHNIMVGTPVATLMQVMFLTSGIIGYWRFHRELQG